MSMYGTLGPTHGGEQELSHKDPGATVRRRMLGMELRRLREMNSISGDQAANQLEWSGAKVSRIEKARTAAHANDVRLLLDLYEVSDPHQREALIELTRTPRRSQGWWTNFPDVIPGKRWSYVRLEDDAKLLRNYEVEFIPGLLQTESYATACFRAAYPTQTEECVERHVAARMARQHTLVRDYPLELWAIINDAALRRVAALPKDTAEQQFARLIEAVEYPNVTLQVLPFDVGPHPGQNGTFTVIRFPDPAGEVVHLDTLTGSFYLEEAHQLESYNLAFDHLKAEALNKAQSIRHIKAFAHANTKKT